MILIDNNISYKIKSSLKSIGVSSLHVSDFNLSSASDFKIWDFAKSENYHLLTKDKDFVIIQNNYGFPPKIIKLNSGNQSTLQIAVKLQKNWKQISDFLEREEIGIINVD